MAKSDALKEGQVTTVTAGVMAVCLIHSSDHGYTALANRCPHQGGPLGEGQLDGEWLICPWHGYEYHPKTGLPPEGYGDCATPLPLEVRADGIYVQVQEPVEYPTVSDQLVQVMTGWGVEMYDASSYEKLWVVPSPVLAYGATGALFSPDGTHLILYHDYLGLEIRDAKSGELLLGGDLLSTTTRFTHALHH